LRLPRAVGQDFQFSSRSRPGALAKAEASQPRSGGGEGEG